MRAQHESDSHQVHPPHTRGRRPAALSISAQCCHHRAECHARSTRVPCTVAPHGVRGVAFASHARRGHLQPLSAWLVGVAVRRCRGLYSLWPWQSLRGWSVAVICRTRWEGGVLASVTPSALAWSVWRASLCERVAARLRWVGGHWLPTPPLAALLVRCFRRADLSRRR